MPSEVILKQKEAAVAELSERIKGAVAGVLVDYKGINVEKDAQMRSELRAAGVEYNVIKNGILVRSAEDAGYSDLKEYLVGPSALAISNDDPIAAAKIIAKYSNELKDHFTIKAGFVDGKVLNQNQVVELSKLPSKEELIAKVMGSLNAPISGLVNVLNGNIRGLAVALGQIAEKKAKEAA